MAEQDRRPLPRTLALEPIAFVYIILGVLLSAAVFGVVRAAGPALTTVAVGVILAMALDPVVSAIGRRWHWPRSRAVVLVMLAVFALMSALVVVMAPRAVDQARELSTDLPATVEQFYDFPVVGKWLEDRDAAGKVDDAVKQLPDQVSDESISATVDSLIGGALAALLVIFVALAVLLDGERMIALGRRLIPPKWAGRADDVGRVFYVAIAQYFGGSLAVAALMGVVVLALCLMFSVPLAPLAAIWAMFTDLIPQVGGFLGGALLGLLALTRGPFVFVAVVGLYVVYMNLENHVIGPAVIGQAVDVTAPTTMLAALVGGAAAGVPGALIATPLVGAVKQLYMQFRWGERPFRHRRPSLVSRVRGLVHKLRHRGAAPAPR